MKGYIFDIKRFSIHDGPGIRTTVFFKGCPLRCRWCHNPESIKRISPVIEEDASELCDNDEIFNQIKEITVEELFIEIEKDVIFYDESGGGVTFSGGEPLIQPDFLNAILKKCKEADIHTAIDTSGFASFDLFEKIYPVADIFLFDLKLIDPAEHKKYTNVSNELIFENLIKLTEMGNKVIIRIPLIPGITDTKENLVRSVEFLSVLKNIRRIDLLPYNKLSESKYERFNKNPKLKGLETQSDAELKEIKSYFLKLNKEILIHG